MLPEVKSREVREIILERIAEILRNEYSESIQEFTADALSAHLAFKGDPHLNELRLALERMERDEYGRCIFCKETMSIETLKSKPTAHFCDQCSRILSVRSRPSNITVSTGMLP